MASKKVKRYRGTTTHGCGSMKKRRGAGNRGGRGNAGSGKRGDGKKPSIWHAEKKKVSVPFHTINVAQLDRRINSWVLAKKATQENDVYVLDLVKLGYTKLLGSGNVKHKYKITKIAATEGAVSKIKAAGGEVQN